IPLGDEARRDGCASPVPALASHAAQQRGRSNGASNSLVLAAFRKRAENGLSYGGSIQSATLRQENNDRNLRLFCRRVADKESVSLPRVSGDRSARFSGDMHSIHGSSMRHAKGDRVFHPLEDGRVNAELVLALAKRELSVGFQQFERRNRDAAIAKGFELEFLKTGRRSDSTAGFLRDEARWRVKSGASQKLDKFGAVQARSDLSDVGITGVGDSFGGIQLRNRGGVCAIQLGGANFQRPVTDELLIRVEFTGFEEGH